MAIDLAEKSNGPAPELLASSPPDNSKWRGPLVQRTRLWPQVTRWAPYCSQDSVREAPDAPAEGMSCPKANPSENVEEHEATCRGSAALC